MTIEYTPEQLEIIAEARRELESEKAQRTENEAQLEIDRALVSVLKGKGYSKSNSNFATAESLKNHPLDEAGVSAGIEKTLAAARTKAPSFESLGFVYSRRNARR
jgi:hypothetical protein